MENEEIELNKPSKIEKIKTHVKDNKEIYITGTICLVVGALTGAYAYKRFGSNSKPTKMLVESIEVGKMSNSNVVQTITKYGYPVGRPGKEVVNTETGRTYASETLAAEDLGVTIKMLSEHLRGKRGPIKGHVFKFTKKSA